MEPVPRFAHWKRGMGTIAMRPSSETAWNKARACDAHAKLTSDDNLRTKFERLRDS